MPVKVVVVSKPATIPVDQALAIVGKLHDEYVVNGFYIAGDSQALAEAANAFKFAPEALKDIVRAALVDILTRMAMATDTFNRLTESQTDEKNLRAGATARLEGEKQEHNGWSAQANEIISRVDAAATALQVKEKVDKAVKSKQMLRKQPEERGLSAMAIVAALLTRPVAGTKAVESDTQSEQSVWSKGPIVSNADPRVTKELIKVEARSKKVAGDPAQLSRAMQSLENIDYPADKLVEFLASLTVACQEQIAFDTDAIAQVSADTSAFLRQLGSFEQEEAEIKATAQFFSVTA